MTTDFTQNFNDYHMAEARGVDAPRPDDAPAWDGIDPDHDRAIRAAKRYCDASEGTAFDGGPSEEGAHVLLKPSSPLWTGNPEDGLFFHQDGGVFRTHDGLPNLDDDRLWDWRVDAAYGADEYLKDRYEMMREAAMDNAGSYENQNHIFNDDRG